MRTKIKISFALVLIIAFSCSSDADELKNDAMGMESLSGLEFTQSERDSALESLVRLKAQYDSLRTIQISNDIHNDFGLFWTGFLVVDRFRESLQSPPFEITLNAFDGLGTLSDFDGTVADFYSSSNTNSYNDIQRIALILQNLDLDIPINCINDEQSLNKSFKSDSIFSLSLESSLISFKL